MKYLTIAIMSLAILVGSHQISRVAATDHGYICTTNQGKITRPSAQTV